MRVRCMVRSCRYIAESKLVEYDDFQVCALHDCKAVRGILEEMEGGPAHYWYHDRPIVQACIVLLDESWWVPGDAGDDAIFALDCKKLNGVDPVPTRMLMSEFDPMGE